MVSANDLNRRITFQQKTDVDNGLGADPVWNDVYTCSAKKENFPHGRGLFRAFVYAQLYPQVTTTFQIRFQRSVQIDINTMRVKYSAHGTDHFYQIMGIENPDEANAFMFLLCREDQAKAVN